MRTEFTKISRQPYRLGFAPVDDDVGANGGTKIDDAIQLKDIGAFVRRHLVFMVVVTAVFTAIGFVYVKTAPPQYTAYARIMIDPQQARLAAPERNFGTLAIESAEVESQVEIIKSEPIAREVVSKLDLVNDAELLGSDSSISSIRKWIGKFFGGQEAPAPNESKLLRQTVGSFLGRLSAYRVGQSYVLEIGFVSASPEKAAQIVNAVTDTYIAAGIRMKSDATRIGAAWLDDRLIDIAAKVNKAAQDVEDFRRTNQIAVSSQSPSLEERQFVELNDQLISARSQVATETAALSTIEAVLSSRNFEGGYVDEALKSPQISQIRSDLLAAHSQLAQLQNRYGVKSPAVEGKQQDISRLNAAIRDELNRIREVHKTNLEMANRRAHLLGESFSRLMTEDAPRDSTRVGLAELESRERTFRGMYESLLAQQTSAVQQETFPLADSRLVAAATVPLGRSAPKSSLILAMSMIFGGCVAIALAGMRELKDRRIRTPQRLQRILGLSYLGRVPKTRFARARKIAGSSSLPPYKALKSLQYVLDQPFSPFTEQLRGCKAAIDATLPREGGRVIGVTSTIRGEGKTTIACNLARMYAAEGFRTILIDADFKHPMVSSILSDPEGEAIIHRMAIPDEPAIDDTSKDVTAMQTRGNRLAVADSITFNKEIAGKLEIMTGIGMKETWNAKNRYEEAAALEAHIKYARCRYELVICDMPALEETADAELIANTLLNQTILIVGNHRRVSLDRLGKAVFKNGRQKFDVAGVIFNKASHKDAFC